MRALNRQVGLMIQPSSEAEERVFSFRKFISKRHMDCSIQQQQALIFMCNVHVCTFVSYSYVQCGIIGEG